MAQTRAAEEVFFAPDAGRGVQFGLFDQSHDS